MRAISIITLGVKNLETSSRFYEDLGFVKSEKSDKSIIWFRTGSTVLALYSWLGLAEDAGVSDTGSGFRGVTLALNLQSKELVNEFIERVRRLGGRVVKEPMMVFWGGYSSYFSDADGHLWEVAWNPFTAVDEVGNLTIEK
jgi:predicted lactoylglutathione lyase